MRHRPFPRGTRRRTRSAWWLGWRRRDRWWWRGWPECRARSACDNSAANCYLLGEITTGAGDVYLGDIGGCPFYIGKAQYAYWRHTQLIIDVIDGHGGTFSLEGPEGKAFHTRSRVFTAEELAALDAEDSAGT